MGKIGVLPGKLAGGSPDLSAVASRWLAGEVARYLPASLVPAAAGFLLVPSLTRLLSVAEYGEFSLLTSALALVSLLFTGWLVHVVARFYPAAESAGKSAPFQRTVYRYTIPSAFLAIATLVTTSWAIPRVLPIQDHAILTLVCLLLLASVLLDIRQSVLRAQSESLRYSCLLSCRAVLKLVGCVGGALVFREQPLFGVLAGWLLCTVLLALLTLPRRVSRQPAVSGPATASQPGLPDLLSFGLPVSMSVLMSTALADGDRFIIRALLGPGPLGLYAAVYVVANGALGLLYPLPMWAAYPQLARIWDSGRSEAEASRLLAQSMRLFFLLAIPSTVGLTLLAHPILALVTAPAYAAQSSIMVPIAAGVLLLGIGQYTTVGLLLRKRTLQLAAVLAISTLVNVLANFYLIPSLGLMGAALATVAGYACYAGLGSVLSRRCLPLRIPWRTLVRAVVAASVMAVLVRACLGFTGSGRWMVVPLVCVGVLTYAASLLALRETRLRLTG